MSTSLNWEQTADGLVITSREDQPVGTIQYYPDYKGRPWCFLPCYTSPDDVRRVLPQRRTLEAAEYDALAYWADRS